MPTKRAIATMAVACSTITTMVGIWMIHGLAPLDLARGMRLCHVAVPGGGGGASGRNIDRKHRGCGHRKHHDQDGSRGHTGGRATDLGFEASIHSGLLSSGRDVV